MEEYFDVLIKLREKSCFILNMPEVGTAQKQIEK